jgi:hypothetical protein
VELQAKIGTRREFAEGVGMGSSEVERIESECADVAQQSPQAVPHALWRFLTLPRNGTETGKRCMYDTA